MAARGVSKILRRRRAEGKARTGSNFPWRRISWPGFRRRRGRGWANRAGIVSASSTDSVIFQIFLEILHIPGGWHWGGRRSYNAYIHSFPAQIQLDLRASQSPPIVRGRSKARGREQYVAVSGPGRDFATAAVHRACPVGTAAQRYVGLIFQGRYPPGMPPGLPPASRRLLAAAGGPARQRDAGDRRPGGADPLRGRARGCRSQSMIREAKIQAALLS
jgi:hypothetical protein